MAGTARLVDSAATSRTTSESLAALTCQHRVISEYPAAAQPDVVRATQKDELYLQYLADSCVDAVRGLLGPRRALLWIRETRLFAEFLYHGLTTGAGLQTLGEEYCDILQVSGTIPGGVPPSAVRRGVTVLLQTLGPYVVQHLPAATSQLPPEHIRDSTDAEIRSSAHVSTHTLSHIGLEETASIAAVQRVVLAHTARQHATVAWAWLSRHLNTVTRLHLALFYFYGIYYVWPKRVTGVRYQFIGKLFERRPNFRILGLLLFGQLTSTAALQLLRSLAGLRVSASLLHQATDSAKSTKASVRPIIVLQENEDAEQPRGTPTAKPYSPQEPHEAQTHRRCPLCLSLRVQPTSTPCGHVFCWQCICEWGVQKPECPLCRATFTASSLVCLYGSDF